jgi:HPt (histidine-containing phosphotransfer) domain-containing protein
MNDLADSYRQALPARIAALEAAREAAGSAADGPALQPIRRIAHALRGSGATYGFPAITAAAATVEDAAPDAMEAAVDALIALLRATAAQTPAADTVRTAPGPES